MQIPAVWSDDVRQMVTNFGLVTAEWVRQGVHTADEVAEWKELIKSDMKNEISVNPAIDPRPRGERIGAWCRTWRELAIRLDNRGR